MVSLEKLNKFYNKGKSNEIHVVDNTTMVLPSVGIVCLLGPSGCGKTTLLNIIGGLDNADLGTVHIGDEHLNNRKSDEVDEIRNAQIGYIFQNFNLIDNRTVFENVAIALRMTGVTDEGIVKERVNYCLEQVGIYQYRNKPAKALSGGQQQRVAIARAIVKNPSVILADEPTGNLDSINTIEIMNIIKKISDDKLVILVTHEQRIAEFYSDHIAEIQDGKIVKAYDNDSSGYLDYQLENRIYLKDMPVEKDFCACDVAVKYFCDDDRPIDIKLVVRGSNLYIDTGGKYNVVDENSNIELIDDHYTRMDENSYRNVEFEYDKNLPNEFRAQYTPMYSFKDSIKNGWASIRDSRGLKKVLMLGFVFAAMSAFLAISNIVGIFDVQPSDYMETNARFITVSNSEKNEKLINIISEMDHVDYVIPGDTRRNVEFPLDDYYQTKSETITLGVSVALDKTLAEEDLILGKLPDDDSEVVIDCLVADRLLSSDDAIRVGIKGYEQVIGRKIHVPNLDDLVVSGITSFNSPSVYIKEDQLMNVITNASEPGIEIVTGLESEKKILKGLNLIPDDLKIVDGAMPKGDYEVIVSITQKSVYPLEQTVELGDGRHDVKIVGYYSSKHSDSDMFASSETVKKDYISQNDNITVCVDSITAVCQMFDSAGAGYYVNKDFEKTSYMNKANRKLSTSFVVAIIILIISLIEMFLMLRSSFMSRIKEIGILRAIGLKKKDVYSMFAGEVLVITLVTSIPGIMLMYYVMSKVSNITSFISGMYTVNPIIAIMAFVTVILFNLLVGLIPVFVTMRKTPAQILARTDI